jgi:protein-tyrosine phosphatase
MKIYEIIPGLLYQSRTTIGLSRPEVYTALDQYGINVVVNLWNKRDPDVARRVSKYIYEPLPDGSNPDLDVYYKHAQYLAKLLEDGQGKYVVLTHCHAGKNRSGLLNAMIIMLLNNVSGKEAHDIILAKRPKALVNEHFCEILDELVLEQV